MLKNSAFHTFLTICFVLILGPYLPLHLSNTFYTISLLIKDLLMFILPIAVFVYISSMLAGLKQHALYLVIILVFFEALSNTLSIFYAYGVGSLLYNKLEIVNTAISKESGLIPYFNLSAFKPKFFTADKGTFLGVFSGLILANSKTDFLKNIVLHLKNYVDFVFSRIFAKLIPLMILGFLLNIQKSGLLFNMAANYSFALLTIIAVIGLYLLFLYGVAGSFQVREITYQLKNMWPVGVIAFTSSSSAATMPFTIRAVEKNLKEPTFAGLIIPATTNIQQIGDCIANVLFCLLIMQQFSCPFPELKTWFAFMVVYVLARFTTAGMMGGAIFILIPIFEKYLGFTPEMSSILLALNIFIDPIVTSSNVLANGALCVIFEKIWLKVKILKKA